MDSDIANLEHEWAHIKYQVPAKDDQLKQMNALAKTAEAVVARYPGRAETIVWDGIITSTEAGMAGPLSALGLAKKSRAMFEAAGKIDPSVLDAAVPTSLGSLYYLVPGFPLGFGDNSKARAYLEQAIKVSPDGMDSNFFYGDFLYRQGEYDKSKQVLTHALVTPPNPNRPVWDAGRRNEIKAILGKIDQKLASSH
jgi:tetratricopeptide (TPR) repeat protein